jgi:hypothetical protein
LPSWNQNTKQVIKHETTIQINDTKQSSADYKNVVLKQIPLDFPFKFLSKSKKLLEKLKQNLTNDFGADLLINSDCYEIKRRRRGNELTNVQESNETWLKKLEIFISKFENDEFEKIKLTQTEQNKPYWKELKEFVFANSKHPEIELNSNAQSDEILIEGTKEAVTNLLKKLNDFESEKIQKIMKEKENITFLKEELPQHLIRLIQKQNFIKICQAFDANLKIILQDDKNSIVFQGQSNSIQFATKSLNKYINNFKKEKFELDWYIADFLNERKEYTDELLQEKSLNCILCIEKLNFYNREMHSIEIVSIEPGVTQKCINLIKETIKVVKYDVVHDSLELIKNLKFINFLNMKVKTGKCRNFILD